MPVFKYRATNSEGKTITGLADARNEGEAIDTLREKNYQIASIEEQKKTLIEKLNSFLGSVKPKDLVVFSRQFAVLISANIALVQSLKLLVEQTSNEKMKNSPPSST